MKYIPYPHASQTYGTLCGFSCEDVVMTSVSTPRTLPRTLHATLANHRGPVHVARYARGTAKYVLTGGQDHTVRLWNPTTGTEIKVYAAHGYEVLSITV